VYEQHNKIYTRRSKGFSNRERELTDEGAKNVAKRLDDNDASAADIAEAFLDDPNGYTEYE